MVFTSAWNSRSRCAGNREHHASEYALEALASQEVDAVLADIRMPGRSGIGVLKALRLRGNLVPVILLTI
jgi:CheY-like chemotaxis protein